MAFRIRKGGLEIEADTAAEAAEALRLLGFDPATEDDDATRQLEQVRELVESHVATKAAEQLRTLSLMMESMIFAGLPAAGARILELLRDREEGMSDSLLCSMLGLGGNQALAGALSGLTKNANRAGLSAEDIIIRTSCRLSSGLEKYHYRLTPRFREILINNSAVPLAYQERKPSAE